MSTELKVIIGGISGLLLVEITRIVAIAGHIVRRGEQSGQSSAYSTSPSPRGLSFVLLPPACDGLDLKEQSFSWGSWLWLQSNIAQVPGCERTPLPVEIKLAANSLGVNGFEIPPADALKTAKMIDATYIGTGSLSKKGGVYTLEYGSCRSGKLVGVPLNASGALNQIAAKLLSLYAEMLSCTKIVVAAPLSRPSKALRMRIRSGSRIATQEKD